MSHPSVSPARAEASRINGAKSRGPKTPQGKARSAQNALKHGLRAERFTVVGDEDEDDYDAHERALLDELAPEGALQTLLAERIARAAWRLARADVIEAMLFDRLTCTDGDLGLALIRDGNNTRSFETLLRYRAAAQAELMRMLRTLKGLQAEAAQQQAAAPAPALPAPAAPSIRKTPNEPKGRRNPGGA
ncbi:MAG: hypothetical protein ACREH3_16380, partial [Geminicoccales bacterium]